MKASFLVCIADNDDKSDPESKNRLRAAFDAAKLQAEIEVYTGDQHGWCPPDSQVYDKVGAEKAWDRQLNLFSKALA
jgi:carboxymethylenebutenolidase